MRRSQQEIELSQNRSFVFAINLFILRLLERARKQAAVPSKERHGKQEVGRTVAAASPCGFSLAVVGRRESSHDPPG